MRVAVLSSTYPCRPGHAVAPWAGEFAEELACAGAEVVVLTGATRDAHRGTSRVEVRSFPWRGTEGRVVDLLSPSPENLIGIASYLRNGSRTLATLCREWQPDVCLALWAVPMGLLARRAARRLGVPYAVWALGADVYRAGRNPLLRPFVRAALRDAAVRFADGHELMREVEELCGRECAFLPTGRTLPPSEPYVGDRPAVVFIGRFEPVKGPDVLLAAAEMAAARGLDFELHLAGSGSLEQRLRVQAEQLALPVRFHIDAEAGEIASLLRGAACVAIPSRAESIPVVFGEALQAGAPLVVTDVGDLGRLAHAGAALAVAPGSPEALAVAIERVLDGSWRPDARAMTELARTFDPRSAARVALGTLGDVVQEHRG